MTLQQHPLSAAFPAMSDSDLEALCEDIKKHGQREPGLLFEGMVLDGWHRYLACEKIGADFWSDGFTGDDPVAFVLSKNLHRRHLNPSQRAGCVVACHNWRANGVSRGAKVHGVKTKAEMAEEAQVSERTIVHAKQAHEVGLGAEVREGAVSAKAAADVAKLPKGKRDEAVKAIKAGEKPSAPPKPKSDDAKLRAELIDVQGKYADLLEKHSELADTARELNDKLQAFETTEPDAQQKLIADLQLKLRRKEAEIDRLRMQIRDANNKNNELIRTVKRLQKNGR